MTTEATKLELPETLRRQLLEYRRYVWTIKVIEATTAACFTVIAAYVFVFVLDRLFDTPDWLRVVAFFTALFGFGLIPWAAHRWVWRQRHLEQLARLLSRKLPSIGDQLLGIIELANNRSEQAKSPALCAAAFKQVAETVGNCELDSAAPNSSHRVWIFLAGGAVMLATVIAVLFPQAAVNAWGRLLAPWHYLPRYTFTQVEPLPKNYVVPHGEVFSINYPLLASSSRQPSTGKVWIGSQPPITAELQDSTYVFNSPPQIDTLRLTTRMATLLNPLILYRRFVQSLSK